MDQDKKGTDSFESVPFLLKNLLGQHFFEFGETGEGVLLRELGLALDEGEDIVDELLLDAVVRVVDPLERDLLLEVCDLVSGSSFVLQT